MTTDNATRHETNVDAAEIAKFEALASRWWDPEGDFRPLHDINPLRLEYIAERVALSGTRALDIGCGGGLLTEALAARGAVVTGIDMGQAPLAVARLHQRESGAVVDYRRSTAEELAAQQPGHYRLVCCMEMLEHVPDPASVIRACAQLAAPGGDVFMSTLNRTPKAYLLAVVGAEYVLRMLPRGTHDYAKFIRPSEMEAWARAAGLELVHLTGMHYNPLTRRYRLAPGLDVNYLAHFRRPAA